jgi:hypothetical protein
MARRGQGRAAKYLCRRHVQFRRAPFVIAGVVHSAASVPALPDRRLRASLGLAVRIRRVRRRLTDAEIRGLLQTEVDEQLIAEVLGSR